MCKANYACDVKGKMSSKALIVFAARSLCLMICSMDVNQEQDCAQKELDMLLYMYIIIFTLEHARVATDEKILLAPAGHAESSLESSAARELSRQRVLRSGRFAAGQVRNAPASGCRQASGQSGSQDVRLFAPVVLSGAGSFSRSRPCRAVTTETRAPFRAQTHTRTDAVRGPASARRTDDLESSDSRANRPTLPCFGSPTQYRSSAAASKKTALTPEAAANSLADRRLVAAYEELRLEAIQGMRRGPGLALMMARGFRCWMEACSQLFCNQASCPPVPDRAAPSTPSGFRGELVILLASMLLRRASKGTA